MDAITVLMYFVVVTLLFLLLANIVQLLYHVSDLLTSICKHVNDLSIHYSNITPKLLALQLLFLLGLYR